MTFYYSDTIVNEMNSIRYFAFNILLFLSVMIIVETRILPPCVDPID